MAKLNDIFPSNYLKASDLNGAQVPVTIERVEVERIGQGANAEQKPVLHFVGKQKGMVANKTNCKKIAEIAGSDDTDDWAGTNLVLFTAMVDYQGETVESIRVKAPAAAKKPTPKPAAPQPVDMDADEIPF